MTDPSASMVSTREATPGTARLGFRRPATGGRTSLVEAFATSPLRILTPRNHGDAAWVFLASLGGGLVDGDRLDVQVDVAAGAAALVGTQASTKVYRSRELPVAAVAAAAASIGEPAGVSARGGCSQRLRAHVAAGGTLAILPDPIVCFADARYEQRIDMTLEPAASLCLLDGYTSGRSARGERWAFSRYASRTTIHRGERLAVVDATLLDPRHGALGERMGRFDAILSLLVAGPAFASVRRAMLAPPASRDASDALVVAASPLGEDACVLRVAAERFETASRALRSSFAALALVLGDDPFARKW
jgi:urease accessory protein